MVVALALAIWYSRAHAPAKAGIMPKTASAGAESEEIRIRSGASAARYVDRTGNIWSSDRFFQGGSVFATPGHAISGTPDPELFRSRREGDFSYGIPLKPGVYELHLYFAETLFGEANTAGGAESSRVFRVLINDKPGLWVFDVISDAGGGNTADERVFKDVSPAKDGMLHLHFAALFKETPFLNAIEIVPGIPGRMHPVRVVAESHNYTDRRGVLWGADRYFWGGRTINSRYPVAADDEPALYGGDRYGNFTYFIPVAPDGQYAATLRFAETYYGFEGKGGPGSRVFDVYCNGTALLRNFDVYKEAGMACKAVKKTFHGLKPNAQGKLALTFVPVVSYASVRAIEIEDETK